MRVGTFASFAWVATLAASALLLGCGASNPNGAVAPEGDPWADYKGTFAGPSTSAPSTSTSAPSTKKETVKAKAVEPEPSAEAPKPAAKAAPAVKKPGKRTAR